MNRSRFWRWRHARPFWGGLFVFLGGTEIFLTVKAPLPVVVHVGMQGFIGYLVPIMVALCGVLLLANPTQRLFYSLIAAVLSLASWLTSNLGGFLVGLLLGLVGSALAFAWTPHRTPAPDGTPAANRTGTPSDTDTPPPNETPAHSRKTPAHSAETRAQDQETWARDHETPAPSHGDQPAQT